MLSQEFNKLIYDYRVVLFLSICLTAQFLSWRMWLRLVKARAARVIVDIVFIVFNLGWFFTVATLYYGKNLTDFTWIWVGRPSVSWQEIYVFVILPLGLLASFSFRFFCWIGKKRGEAVIKPLPGGALPQPGQGGPLDGSRRDFIRRVGGGAGALGILGICGYGVARQSISPDVKRHTLYIPGLPPQLDGFVIAHITDLHLGLWASQKEIDQAFKLIASEKPDMVVFTGDQVDRSAENAKLYHEPLRRFRMVPEGVWGVLGNHDHYTGKPSQVARYLTEGGLNILVDRQVNLPRVPISIIGLDDQGVHSSWLGRGGLSLNEMKDDPDALNFALVKGPAPRPDDFTILLNHRPEGFAQAARHGCRLYLAGHTHGGQYRCPFNDQINLAASFYKYSSGLYHEHGAWLNVSPGIAAVGVPFRLWAWPELSLFRLKRKP